LNATYRTAHAKATDCATKAKKGLLDTLVACKREALYNIDMAKQLAWAFVGTFIAAGKKGKAKTTKIVSDKTVQSAAGGAVVVGAGGGAAGLATGGAIGAAVGLVPALFTFGLSIPFFAMVGGGCGLAAGTTLGGATGAVAGAGGYQVYTRRAAIRAYTDATMKKVQTNLKAMSEKARTRVDGAMAKVNGAVVSKKTK